MSKKVSVVTPKRKIVTPKEKKRPNTIPYKKSELFFVFTSLSTPKETIIIDGPPRIIKKILITFACTIKQNRNKQNIVKCDKKIIKSLKEVLYKFQEQSIIKFVVFCPCKCRSKIKHSPRDVIAKVSLDRESEPLNFTINIPPEDAEIIKDASYEKYKGETVKIVANSVDGVARIAKLMGVMLSNFDDNCLEGDFTAYGVIQ